MRRLSACGTETKGGRFTISTVAADQPFRQPFVGQPEGPSSTSSVSHVLCGGVGHIWPQKVLCSFGRGGGFDDVNSPPMAGLFYLLPSTIADVISYVNKCLIVANAFWSSYVCVGEKSV